MNDAHAKRSAHDGSGRSTGEVPAVLDRELSRSDRLRTHLAFAGIVVLGTLWMVVTGYVLIRRRRL